MSPSRISVPCISSLLFRFVVMALVSPSPRLSTRRTSTNVQAWPTSSQLQLQLTPSRSCPPHSEPAADGTFYQSITGALQYLTLTRPDIAYAVNQDCLYMHSPMLLTGTSSRGFSGIFMAPSVAPSSSSLLHELSSRPTPMQIRQATRTQAARCRATVCSLGTRLSHGHQRDN